MSDPSRKIELSENHHRAIAALMRGTERACDEVAEWLDHSSSVLIEVRADLEPGQQTRLRELATKLKVEIEQFASKVSLDKRRISRRRAVAAIVSAALIDLYKVQESELEG
jgi:hypothetical protein